MLMRTTSDMEPLPTLAKNSRAVVADTGWAVVAENGWTFSAESGWPLRRQRRVPRGAGTTTIPAVRPDVAKKPVPEHGWKVVLHNDDVTELDVVIFALQRAAGLSLEVAEMVALEAHHEDSAVVKRGLTQDEADGICTRLVQFSSIQGISDGVRCEALPDNS
jgi:ATP-dependent Clp protease adapter protein ClpS